MKKYIEDRTQYNPNGNIAITEVEESDGGFNYHQLKVKKHSKDVKFAVIPEGDWQDLAIVEDVEMKAGEFRKISFGFAMKLPEGYEAHIVPRSSTFERYGIIQTNGIGIIDNKYEGNNDIWMLPCYATMDIIIPAGTRTSQFRLVEKQKKLKIEYVENLEGEDRGGFGQSGL